MIKLSVAIATYNEEKKLGACLASVSSWADEIVVVDGGSTDATVEIAGKFRAKVTVTTNPPIFHINKQKAVDLSTQKWVLQLDADELVSDELKKEISAVVRNERSGDTYEGYYLPRKNYFLGQWMKKGGQYPDYVIRLFRKGKGRFPSKSVHEQIAIDGNVGYLKNPLLHYPYQTLREYFEKANRYSLLTARELGARSQKVTLTATFGYMLVRPLLIFGTLYVRHAGFLDGTVGLLFALLSALQPPMAYIKYIRYFYGKGINVSSLG